jgi:hypothetical protein
LRGRNGVEAMKRGSEEEENTEHRTQRQRAVAEKLRVEEQKTAVKA